MPTRAHPCLSIHCAASRQRDECLCTNPSSLRVHRLDSKLLYAQELYLPDGTRLTSWKALAEAAAANTPVVVTCGVRVLLPAEPSSVPM